MKVKTQEEPPGIESAFALLMGSGDQNDSFEIPGLKQLVE